MDKKHHIYITNIQNILSISKNVLNAKGIVKLYGTGLDIELLSKELKSKYIPDVL